VPLFLGQREKGQDASATGLPVGVSAGKVEIVGTPTSTGY